MLHPSFPVCVTCTDVFTQVTYHMSLAEKTDSQAGSWTTGNTDQILWFFFLRNHRISKMQCQRVEDIMFLFRSANAVCLGSPPGALQTYTISQLLHFLWKDCVNRKAHYTKVSELRLHQKQRRHLSPFFSPQRNHSVTHTCKSIHPILSDNMENVSHRILPRPLLHSSYNTN